MHFVSVLCSPLPFCSFSNFTGFSRGIRTFWRMYLITLLYWPQNFAIGSTLSANGPPIGSSHHHMMGGASESVKHESLEQGSSWQSKRILTPCCLFSFAFCCCHYLTEFHFQNKQNIFPVILFCVSSHCMQQILESVNYCHQMGIVHRDLKVGELVSDGQNRSALFSFHFHFLQSDEYPSSTSSFLVSSPQILPSFCRGHFLYSSPLFFHGLISIS